MLTHFVRALLIVSISLTSLTACETMEGMGDDVEEAGDEVEDEF